jgi:hypothetical protein
MYRAGWRVASKYETILSSCRAVALLIFAFALSRRGLVFFRFVRFMVLGLSGLWWRLFVAFFGVKKIIVFRWWGLSLLVWVCPVAGCGRAGWLSL